MKIFRTAVEEKAFDDWVTVEGCRIVYAGIRQGCMNIWYTISEEEPGIKFQYRVVGTGWHFDGKCIVAASVIDEPFVWHILERNAR